MLFRHLGYFYERSVCHPLTGRKRESLLARGCILYKVFLSLFNRDCSCCRSLSTLARLPFAGVGGEIDFRPLISSGPSLVNFLGLSPRCVILQMCFTRISATHFSSDQSIPRQNKSIYNRSLHFGIQSHEELIALSLLASYNLSFSRGPFSAVHQWLQRVRVALMTRVQKRRARLPT